MDKDSAKTRSFPALRRGQGCRSSRAEHSVLPAGDGRKRKDKRKASPESNTNRKRKRICEVAEPCHSSEEDGRAKGEKRKVGEDGEGPSKENKKRRNDLSRQQCDKSYTGRAQFEARYEEHKKLGKGGCGSVFAGSRKADNLPVAIKHIPLDKVYCKHLGRNGKQLSVEVAVMLKLEAGKKGSVGTSAPVSLLDWYDLGQELILVLERPVPAEDLQRFKEDNGGSLQEEEAKTILKQLVDAAAELQNRKVFHRDIKMENILIETGTNIPRVRLIDFGLSCIVKKRSSYNVFYGTCAHTPPELYSCCQYRPEPTTVWQLGVVLFETLHSEGPFETTQFLSGQLKISTELSENCQDFLQGCLTKVPAQRPTLKELQLHPWLQ